MATYKPFDIKDFVDTEFATRDAGLTNQKAYKKLLLAQILKGTDVSKTPLQLLGNLAKTYAGLSAVKDDKTAQDLLKDKATRRAEIRSRIGKVIEQAKNPIISGTKDIISGTKDIDVPITPTDESEIEPDTIKETIANIIKVPNITHRGGTLRNLAERLRTARFGDKKEADPALSRYAQDLAIPLMQEKSADIRWLGRQRYTEEKKKEALRDKRAWEEANPDYTVKTLVTGSTKDGSYQTRQFGVNKKDPTDKKEIPNSLRYVTPKKGFKLINHPDGTTELSQGTTSEEDLATWKKKKDYIQLQKISMEERKSFMKELSTISLQHKATDDFIRQSRRLRSLIAKRHPITGKKIYNYSAWGLAGSSAAFAKSVTANLKGAIQIMRNKYRNKDMNLKTMRFGTDNDALNYSEELAKRNKDAVDDVLGEANKENAALRSAIVGLGFRQAIINNNGGSRISDADFIKALEQIGANAMSSPEAMESVLLRLEKSNADSLIGDADRIRLYWEKVQKGRFLKRVPNFRKLYGLKKQKKGKVTNRKNGLSEGNFDINK